MNQSDFQNLVVAYQDKIAEISQQACALHKSVGQTYGKDLPYGYHLTMVAEKAIAYAAGVLKEKDDFLPLVFGAFYHDSIEDARLTYNDVKKCALRMMDERQALMAAEIVYALTNDKGRTREERAGEHYYAGIRNTPYAPYVKLCDRLANMTFSFTNSDASNLHMREVYRKEWPHFIQSITVKGDDERFQIPKEALSAVAVLMESIVVR